MTIQTKLKMDQTNDGGATKGKRERRGMPPSGSAIGIIHSYSKLSGASSKLSFSSPETKQSPKGASNESENPNRNLVRNGSFGP